MGKLSILGAQRIKALTEVLKDNEKDEIGELKKVLPKASEIEEQVREEFGIEEYFIELEGIKERLSEISEVLELKAGKQYSLTSRNVYNMSRSKFNDRVAEIKKEYADDKVETIRRKYRKKEQQLWLCETLEEAKEIVGIQ